MSLDSFRVFRLSQNLQKLFIRKEEETRETSSFGLQILGKTFLNVVKQTVTVLKLGLITLTFDIVPHVLFLSKHLKSCFPMFVNLIEFHQFIRHLLLDIL